LSEIDMAEIDLIRQMFRDLLMRNGDLDPFADDEGLFSAGRLQSIDGVEMVVFLEEKFGLDFARLGFDPESIDSVSAVAALVARPG
jgi:acyl carrier protein